MSPFFRSPCAPFIAALLSSSSACFTGCYQDILYRWEFSGERSTAPESKLQIITLPRRTIVIELGAAQPNRSLGEQTYEKHHCNR
jgi:hypothetical protein